MKTFYYTFCLTATCAFMWFASSCYQKATAMTLGEFIDAKNAEMVTEKMNDLYGGAYVGVH